MRVFSGAVTNDVLVPASLSLIVMSSFDVPTDTVMLDAAAEYRVSEPSANVLERSGQKNKSMRTHAEPNSILTSLAGDDPPRGWMSGGFCGTKYLRLQLPLWAWVSVVLLVACTCAGVLFGFPSLAGSLALEGAFGGSQASIASLFTVGSVASFLSPLPAGALLASRGQRTAMAVATSVFALGATAGLAAAATRTDGLWWLCTLCLGASAQPLVLPLYSYARMCPRRRRGCALAAINGAFDSGTLVLAAGARAHAAGASLTAVWATYLGGPVALLVIAAFFLWRDAPWPEPAEAVDCTTVVPASEASAQPRSDVPAGSLPGPPSSLTEHPRMASAASRDGPRSFDAGHALAPPIVTDHDPTMARRGAEDRVDDSDEDEAALTPASPLRGRSTRQPPAQEPSAFAVPSSAAGAGFSAASAPTPPAARAWPGDHSRSNVDLLRLDEQPALAQLRSPAFLSYAAFFAALFTFYVTFLATAAAQLASLGDDGTYLVVLGAILPCGGAFQLLAGPTIDRAGAQVALAVAWSLAVMTAALISVPFLRAQAAAAVAFAAFRAFFFTSMTAHLAATFGWRTLGLTVGVVVLVGGVAGLTQLAFLAWGEARGSFVEPNAALLCIVTVAGAFPLSLAYTTVARERSMRARPAAEASLPARQQALSLVSALSRAPSARRAAPEPGSMQTATRA